MNEREFMAYLLQSRDRLVYLMKQGLSKPQVTELGRTLDELIRDLREAYDRPRTR